MQVRFVVVYVHRTVDDYCDVQHSPMHSARTARDTSPLTGACSALCGH
jgi:hypothetical protein